MISHEGSVSLKFGGEGPANRQLSMLSLITDVFGQSMGTYDDKYFSSVKYL